MRAQRLFCLDLKQAYAMVLRIHDIKAAACVNPHAGRTAEVCPFDCAGIKPVEHLPFVAEDLNPVKVRITDIDIALLVHRQSGVTICIAQRDRAQEMALSIENLNAPVARIDHKKFTAGYDYLTRETEFSGTFTTAALPELANQVPAPVHHEDHVSLPIAHVNASRSSIDRDSYGALEV